MKDNFETCLAETLSHEGGWADHPKDPGGATMKGVTIATFARFKGRQVTRAELRAISDADLRAIYRQGYWSPVRGDDLPAGLDLAAFDPAVNSGVSRAVRWLQVALGVKADGVMGQQTLAAAQAAPPVEAVQRACAARMGFLRGLRTWGTFGKGWSRRVASIEAVAVRMALAARAAPVQVALAIEAERAEGRARSDTVKAAGAGGAGAGGVSLADLPDWGMALAAVAIIAVIVIFIGQRRHEQHRAQAYREQSNV